MISTIKQLRAYIAQDSISMGIPPYSGVKYLKAYLSNNIIRYLFYLRLSEYLKNSKNLLYYISNVILKNTGYKLGFSIPINSCGPGLSLPHYGTLVINKKAKLGKNCRIHVCVNIGANFGSDAPIIGDNVYIAPGAKLFGPIIIGNNSYVGANAVINKSFPLGNQILIGVPVKEAILKPDIICWWEKNEYSLMK